MPKADAVIHAGDMTYRGEKSEVLDFLAWFGALPYRYKIFIAGNHDFYFEKQPPDVIQKTLPRGVIYLNDSGITIEGIQIWGSPVTPWFFNWAFNRQRGPSINNHWKKIPEHTDILVTHGPAFGLLDTVLNGRNTGDKDLYKRITAVKPKVHICGHIHEAYGMTVKEGTRYINACVLNESYELVNKPVLFEL